MMVLITVVFNRIVRNTVIVLYNITETKQGGTGLLYGRDLSPE